MRFRYTRYSENVLRPVIRIGVAHGERSLDYDVLVDSGADINVFHTEIAEALGLDLESGVAAEVVGATGEPVSVYVHALELRMGDHTFTSQVAFMPKSGPVGLAGQRGFFDQFRVTFDLPSEEIEIVPHQR